MVCSCISGTLKPDPSFRRKRCTGQARLVYGRPMTEDTVGREKLELMPFFCYIVDCLSSGGGCELHHTMLCHMAKIQRAPARAYLPFSFQSPPEEGFTIRASGARCSIQAKTGPWPQLMCVVCNENQRLWSVGWMVSPLWTKSIHKIWSMI